MDIYYIDGEFVPAEKAFISVDDMIVLRGYGIFDFLRTYGKHPFHLADHIKRLHRSAEMVGIPFPWPVIKIEEIVMRTLAENNHEESNIRIIITGGPGLDSVIPSGKPRLLVLVTPCPPVPEQWKTEGVKIVTYCSERFIPEAKSTNYMSAVLALDAARKAGAQEAVYVDHQDRVLEGTGTNIFLFKNGTLVTPQSDILPGITREVLLHILRGIFPIEERDVALGELTGADEVFLCGSGKEVAPVVMIDEQVIGNGKVGVNTKKVIALFTSYTAQYGATR